MKIKELIKKLKKFDGNIEIVVSSDGEGNSFSILNSIDFDKDSYFNISEGQFYENSELDVAKQDYKAHWKEEIKEFGIKISEDKIDKKIEENFVRAVILFP